MKVVLEAVVGGPITNMRKEEDDYALKSGENVLEGATEIPVLGKYSVWGGKAIVENTTQEQADQIAAQQMQTDIQAALPGWDQNKAAFDALLLAVNNTQTVADIKAVLTTLITDMEAQVKAFNWIKESL